jgi:hypothetical protein
MASTQDNSFHNSCDISLTLKDFERSRQFLNHSTARKAIILTSARFLAVGDRYNSDDHNALRWIIGDPNAIEALPDFKYIIS